MGYAAALQAAMDRREQRKPRFMGGRRGLAGALRNSSGGGGVMSGGKVAAAGPQGAKGLSAGAGSVGTSAFQPQARVGL